MYATAGAAATNGAALTIGAVYATAGAAARIGAANVLKWRATTWELCAVTTAGATKGAAAYAPNMPGFGSGAA